MERWRDGNRTVHACVKRQTRYLLEMTKRMTCGVGSYRIIPSIAFSGIDIKSRILSSFESLFFCDPFVVECTVPIGRISTYTQIISGKKIVVEGRN